MKEETIEIVILNNQDESEYNSNKNKSKEMLNHFNNSKTTEDKKDSIKLTKEQLTVLQSILYRIKSKQTWDYYYLVEWADHYLYNNILLCKSRKSLENSPVKISKELWHVAQEFAALVKLLEYYHKLKNDNNNQNNVLKNIQNEFKNSSKWKPNSENSNDPDLKADEKTCFALLGEKFNSTNKQLMKQFNSKDEQFINQKNVIVQELAKIIKNEWKTYIDKDESVRENLLNMQKYINNINKKLVAALQDKNSDAVKSIANILSNNKLASDIYSLVYSNNSLENKAKIKKTDKKKLE